MADTAAPAAAAPTDAASLLRTKDYRVLLVLAAIIGVLSRWPPGAFSS